MWRHNNLKSTLILSPLVIAFALALDIYIPAIPKMIRIFHVSPGIMQLTLSLFLFVFGVSQLFIGPYSDQWGRWRAVLGGAIAYTLSSLLCALANSIILLIIFRVLQSFSASIMIVTANAIVRDVFDRRASAQIYSYLMAGISLSPLLAPILGGYMDLYFGWRACFVTLAIFGIFATIIILRYINETLPVNKRTAVNYSIFRRYGQMLSHPDLQFYASCNAVGISMLFTFFSLSPYLLIDHLSVPSQHFGYYFAIMGLLSCIGSFLAGKLVIHLGVNVNSLIGIISTLIGGIWMCLWFYIAGKLTIADFILPMAPIALGAAFLLGSGMAGAMHPFGTMAGTAAALTGCIGFTVPAITGSIIMLFHPQSGLPLGAVATVFTTILLIWWCYRYYYGRR